MDSQYQYDVTVLMINYRPIREKVFATLRSLILQKNVLMQIVVADDGSENNMFDEIEAFFIKNGFMDYELVNNANNQGTTLNFYSGLNAAKGKYLKGISPGDYLYNDLTLYKWISYMEDGEHDCSFGDAVYYRLKNGIICPIKRDYGYPVIPTYYDIGNYDERRVFLSCFILEDYILGASYFCRTKLVKKYINPLLGKVRYLEDALYRMMLLDHIRSIHYPQTVVVYEYGTGVSTTKNEIWKQRVEKDKLAITDITFTCYKDNNFCKKYKKYLSIKSKTKIGTILKMMIVFPRAFFLKVYRGILIRNGRVSTSTLVDEEFMERIGGYHASH